MRCGPAKRRRNSLLIHLRHAAPPADGRYRTLHAPALTLSAGA
ncbi:hypothetical protein CDS [Salmonella enterica subsp. enterica serovar Derby]|nr:hypothetical protein CDS [Salmonella enterica subsp. enterica serovar Derby]